MSEETRPLRSKPENENLARLLTLQQQEFGDTDRQFAARWTDMKDAWRSFIDWRTGKRAPSPSVRADIENGIGWKPGSISLLLTGAGAFKSLSEVQNLPAEERPVKRASDLTDDELAMEMMRRFRNYADMAHQDTAPPVPDLYDLAANHPLTPKRFKTPKN